LKKIWANFQRIVELKTQKALKNMGLGSGIRKKPIPDPGSRVKKAPNSSSRIRNTDRNDEPLPVEDAACTEEDEGGEEARRTPRILLIQPPDIRIRHVHAAHFNKFICKFLTNLKGQ
jgi:hypothetical protein